MVSQSNVSKEKVARHRSLQETERTRGKMLQSSTTSSLGDHRGPEREALRNVIAQWNANRLDIFELSEPNEDLEFHGVMRFYFQDAGQKVATKCIRVASDATVEDVIGTLIEKFRPDMRMLSVPSYALFELHENCPERKMSPEEKPLLVQLNWHVDDREGRFLLKNIDDKTSSAVGLGDSNSSFRRKLSKREKKQLKKQEKQNKLKKEIAENADVAEKLYTELPESSFTRSISNPEAVMRRQRQKKLEKKLQQFRSKDGGPDTGGTLKIYGEALCKDVPYKTLLLSVRDCAGAVVREMLDKYGLNHLDPAQWCLAQVTQTPGASTDAEYVLDEDECPLSILMNSPSSCSIMFHVRRRPADCAPRKRKKKPGSLGNNNINFRDQRTDAVPLLVELGPDGSPPHPGDTTKTLRLVNEVMEVGSANGIALQLYGPHIQPRHCVITNTDSVTSLTPCHTDAQIYVNGQRIYQTAILNHGSLIKFGKSNTYRFLDPSQEDFSRGPSMSDLHRASAYDRSPHALSPNANEHIAPNSNQAGRDYRETSFDIDGNVETISTTSARDDTPSIRQYDGKDNSSSMGGYPRGTDPILPAVLEFPEEPQEQFLARVITHLDVHMPTFKLAPAYTLYLCARYRASTHYRPELTPNERAHKLTLLLQRAAMLVRHTVQDRSTDNNSQAFWLANASELLHFLKQDRHVSAFSVQAQDILADSVQLAFKNLLACFTDELNGVMPGFMTTVPEEHPNGIINVLSNAMNLLRRCRVNAALTIQLFSQLFNRISSKALSIVINNPQLCCRMFGKMLGHRLRNLQIWAESLGLELAAECHLAKIIQCIHLLQGPKCSAEDLANLSSTCFKLNSLQLRALLTQYKCEPGEMIASPQMLEQAARASEGVADELARAEGKEVRLHEDPSSPFQLLLPDDGYSCDVVQGVPSGLAEFLLPLQASGLCRLAAQPTSSGHWTVYMTSPRPTSAMSSSQPEVQIIKLHKTGGGMGLSIVAAKGAGQERLGIYIKSVVPGGAADRDGRLAAGDQLLSVDGHSLLGITQEKAAEFLVRTGNIVSLEVAKGGAVYHGLATLLQQPSPTPNRALDKFKVGYTRVAHSQDSLNFLRTPPVKAHNVFFASDENLTYRTDPQIVITPPAKLQIPQILIEDISETERKMRKSTSLNCASSLLKIEPFSKSLQDLSTSNSTISSAAYASQLDLSNPDADDRFWKSPKSERAPTMPANLSIASSYPQLSMCSNSEEDAVKKCRSDEVMGSKLSKYERLEILKMLCDLNVRYENEEFSCDPQADEKAAYIYYSLPNLENFEHIVAEGNVSPSNLETTNKFYSDESFASCSNRKIEDDFMHHCKFAHCIFNYDYTNVGTKALPKRDTTTTLSSQETKFSRSTPLRNILNQKLYQSDVVGEKQVQQDQENIDELINNNNNNVAIAAIGNASDNNNESERRKDKSVHKCCCLATSTCPILTKYYMEQLYGRQWKSSDEQIPKSPQRNNDRQFCARRMSERDLPSKIDTERTILASKSVPALHHLSPGMESRILQQHDSFNPGYSRTSSSNSINTASNPNNGIRSRSTHNLNNHSSSVQQDSSFYQNLSVYRNKMPMNSMSPPQLLGDRSSALRSSQISLQSNLAHQQHQRPTSACYTNNSTSSGVPSRALHQSIPNLKHQRINESLNSASYPNVNQHNQSYRHSSDHHESEVSYGNMTGYLSPASTLKQPINVNIQARHDEYSHYTGSDLLKERDEAYNQQILRKQHEEYYMPHEMARYSSSGNIRGMQDSWEDKNSLRGQAKMAEMSEEVRRRQMMNKSQSNHELQMVQNMKNMQNMQLTHQHSYYNNKFPPIAPKPLKKSDEHIPEPPPTSTHPLYMASSQDPPKMTYCPNPGVSSKQTRDPWVREEQERQEQYRRELSRQWQEQQIKDLSLIPQRTQQQEEQLRVLQFEREFQRRAQEAAELDDDDHTEKSSPTIAAKETPLSILKGAGGVPNQKEDVSVPLPPERGVSYAIMSMRSKEGPKRVSFNDPTSPPQIPDTLQLEERREDPNVFIKQAEFMLSSPTHQSDGFAGVNSSTPGVIGAQEVYRDPRQKRLDQQAQQKTQTQTPVPEKLSFKEKMKMFAMETGEQETPKDKSKISRAQREIDSIASPNSSLVH